MVNNCVVFGCGKTSDQTPVFKPSQKNRKAWIKFVRRKRPKWASKQLHICSDHFTKDCYENYYGYMSGYYKVLRLKKDAVPKLLGTEVVQAEKTRSAFRKREVERIIADYDERNKKLAEAEERVNQSTESRDPIQTTDITEPGSSSVTPRHSLVPTEQIPPTVGGSQSADGSCTITAESAGHSVDNAVATSTLANVAHCVVDTSFTAANAGHSSADARFTAVNVGQCNEDVSITALKVGCPAQEVPNEVKLEVKLSGYGDLSETDTSSESAEPSLAVRVRSVKKVSVATQTAGLQRVKGCQTNSLRYHGIQMIDAESPQTVDQGCDPVFPPEIQLIGVLPSYPTAQ